MYSFHVFHLNQSSLYFYSNEKHLDEKINFFWKRARGVGRVESHLSCVLRLIYDFSISAVVQNHSKIK